MTSIQSTHPMGPDGIIRCKHGEQVDRFVSQTPANPGRYVPSRAHPHLPLMLSTASFTDAADHRATDAIFGVSIPSRLYFSALIPFPPYQTGQTTPFLVCTSLSGLSNSYPTNSTTSTSHPPVGSLHTAALSTQFGHTSVDA